MLFAMLERGMSQDVTGDKGKKKSVQNEKGDEAIWAVVLAKELWKTGVWYGLSSDFMSGHGSDAVLDRNDAKTVAIMSMGCLHPNTKVQSASIHFFLGDENEDKDGDSDDDEVRPSARISFPPILIHNAGPGYQETPTPARDQEEDPERGQEIDEEHESSQKGTFLSNPTRLVHSPERTEQKRNKPQPTSANFPALQLIRDPQTFAEKLYEKLAKHGPSCTCQSYSILC